MPSHGKEVPLLKRVAILTLHWYGDKNWIEISTLLKVHPETARAICVRAKVSEPYLRCDFVFGMGCGVELMVYVGVGESYRSE